MTYIKIAGCIFLAFSLNLVYAQSWEHFSTKNNIPSNHITGIVIDSYNEKWMTTGGGGLVGFDGKFWKIYNSTTTDERLKTNFLTCITIQGDVKWIGTKTGLYKFEIKDEEEIWTEYNSINTNKGLPVSQVNEIVADKEGSLWIATNNGVSRLKDSTWTYYSKYSIPEMAGNKVASIAIDEKGNKWVGTSTGLCIYDGEKWRNLSKGNLAFSDENIQKIIIDKSNNIWIATGGGGIVKYNGKEWKHYASTNVNTEGFTDNIKAIFCDKENNIWLAGQKGLIKYHEEKFEHIKDEEAIKFNDLPLCIIMDLKGEIWVGTEKTGLWCFNDKGWRNYNAKNNLPNDFIYTLAIDHEHKIWIGTNGGGMVKFSTNEWVIYNESNGLNDLYIKAMVIERKHNIYAGSEWGGLLKFDGFGWQTFNTSNSRIPSDHINAVEFDDKDNIWLGTEGNGIIAFDGENWLNFTSANTTGMIPDDHITSVQFERKTKTLWVGTQSGLCTYKSLTWKNLEYFAQKNITAIEIDTFGNKWIGTTEGIYKMNDAKIEFYNHEKISDELYNLSINTIYADNKGVVWFGAEQGLIKYENNTWKVYNSHTTFGSLSSENIFSIIRDAKDYLWVGTSNGLFKGDFSAASSAEDDSDRDGIIDSLDLCPFESGVSENRGCPALEDEKKATLENAFTHLLFETNKDVILQSSFKSLNHLADLLVRNPKLKLYVEGHTDNSGDENKNRELSQRRANAVKEYLTSRGVDKTRIVVRGFGSSKPKTSNDTEEGRKINRRVEMILYQGK